MGCRGDAHCPLKCVAIAARWSVSFFVVCKMFEEFCSGEHRLRREITKTHRLQTFFQLFIFLCSRSFLSRHFF